MSILISFPIVLLLIILQTTFARELSLLNGSADLLLILTGAWALHCKDNSAWFWAILSALICGFVSAVPWYVYFISYLAIVILANVIRGKLWQSPMMSMFFITMVGSIVHYLLTLVSLQFSGTFYPWQDTMVRVIIPSIFLNLILAIPMYVVMKDTAEWVFRSEVTK